MTALQIAQLIALGIQLTPEVIKLVNNMIEAFKDSTPEDRIKALETLQATLKPMELKG